MEKADAPVLLELVLIVSDGVATVAVEGVEASGDLGESAGGPATRRGAVTAVHNKGMKETMFYSHQIIKLRIDNLLRATAMRAYIGN